MCVRVYICSVHTQKFLMERTSLVSDNQDLSLCHGAPPKLPTSSDICILLNYKASEHMWRSQTITMLQFFNWLPREYLPWRSAPPNASTVSPLNLPSLIITFRSPDTQFFFGHEGGAVWDQGSLFSPKIVFSSKIQYSVSEFFIGMQM